MTLYELLAVVFFRREETGVSQLPAQNAAQGKRRAYFHTWESGRPFLTSSKAPRDVGLLISQIATLEDLPE